MFSALQAITIPVELQFSAKDLYYVVAFLQVHCLILISMLKLFSRALLLFDLFLILNLHFQILDAKSVTYTGLLVFRPLFAFMTWLKVSLVIYCGAQFETRTILFKGFFDMKC